MARSAAMQLAFVALGLFTAASATQLRAATGAQGSPDVVTGHLKGLMDGYIEKYDEEVVRFKEADEAMQNLVDNTADMEAKSRAIDEKQKLQREHEEKLEGLVGFVRTLDAAVKAMVPGSADWKEKYADMKTKVDAMYAAHPAALLSKAVNVKSGGNKTAATSQATAVARATAEANLAEAYLKYIGGHAK
eukprot:TRINITY_DN20614_c0_g1_i1.p1 TRINITY_DN20614_c0_g1~~TRINITY_DN20614_c0_g1_i1.p1  ORF type:complete len:190 (+),score=77.37 TRINITY_DN20614_c0_g1_i1:74-643(+)